MIKRICVYLIGVVMLAASANAQEIVTITGEKWPPYNNYVLDRNHPGLMMEIVMAIFKENGLRFHYTERPKARAIEDTRSGTVNALIGLGVGDAPDFIFPLEEIGVTRRAFYVRRDSDWRFTGMESLTQVRLGVLKSMTYGYLLDDYIMRNKNNKARIDIISGQNYLARNFIKLGMGRIDATIDDDIVVRNFLKNSGQIDQFVKAGRIGEGYAIFIAFSPRYTHAKKMAALTADGVQKMRRNGELERILSKYGVRDWRK